MSFTKYFKEKFLFIGINIAMLIVSAMLLKLLNLSNYSVIFILFLNLIGNTGFYIYDYLNRKKYYKKMLKINRELDKKYLISEVIGEPNFADGEIFYEVLNDANKSMNDEIAKYRIANLEYREYIELWVHEIKTPLAAVNLIAENNPSSVTESIGEEVKRVEDFIEQVLFYSRSNSLEKDYSVKEINLKAIVSSVIRKNANSLIEKNIKIELENLDMQIFSDSKWVEFIIHQIISNSIKYMDKAYSVIKIYGEEVSGEVILRIQDNGIGISEKSKVKVFEKGYTGENGRRFGKSTGMGLYLCKKLCNKLGLGINLKSEESIGTEVSILFPNNTMISENFKS